MNFNEAIEQLEEDLKFGCDVDESVQRISLDYNLKQELLLRKFAEKHAKSPEHWVPPIDRQVLLRREASARAKRLSKNCRAGHEPYLRDGEIFGDHIFEPGTLFCADGSEWAFVGLKSDGTISAVLVGDEQSDEQVMVSSFNGGSVPSFHKLSKNEIIRLIRRNLVVT